MDFSEIKTLVLEQGEAFKSFKASHEAKLAELEARFGESAPEPKTVQPVKPADPSYSLFNLKTGEALPMLRLSDPWPNTGACDGPVSFGRMLRGMVTGNWRGSESELKALAGGSGPGGEFLLPDTVSSTIIEAVRKRLGILRAGMVTVPMPDRFLTLAAVDGVPSAGWVAEEAAIPFDTSMSFKAVSLTAKKLATIIAISQELAEDAENLEAVVMNELARSMAEQLDYSALGTLSANGITGLLGALEAEAGTPNIDSAGGAFTYDRILDAYYTLLESDNPESGLSMLSNPRAAKALDLIKDETTGQYIAPPATVGKLNRILTTQIPVVDSTSDTTNVFYGNFADAVLGLRHDIRLEVSREAGDSFQKHQVYIKATWRGDVGIIRGASFHVQKNVVV